jgi:hypothetical protein
MVEVDSGEVGAVLSRSRTNPNSNTKETFDRGGVGWGSTGEGLALPLASLGRIERGRSPGGWRVSDIPPSGIAQRDTAHGLQPRQRRLPTRLSRSRFPPLLTANQNASKALATGPPGGPAHPPSAAAIPRRASPPKLSERNSGY